MANCGVPSGEYTWQNCEDFQVPSNSVWYGRDDDGSDIFCGKAWCDGEEVPAQVIPNRRECRIIDNGCERIVPNCRKVLICRRNDSDRCHRRRDHCHGRRHHCDSSSSDEEESCSSIRKQTCCNNESKLLEKSVKSCSSSTTVSVKKDKKKHHKKDEDCGEECWYETRTRMVPKVTVQPRVRYLPKVINERTVRYVQEAYTIKVCGKRRCEPCEPCRPCEPCEPCQPCEPYVPCEPRRPCEPCDPCRPLRPCEPCSSNRRSTWIIGKSSRNAECF